MSRPQWYSKADYEIIKYIEEKAKHHLHIEDNIFELIQRHQPNVTPVIQLIYEKLIQQGIKYTDEQNRTITGEQYIREAIEILKGAKEGTCLDLAVLFCSICYGYKLLPILIIFEDHAIASVCTSHVVTTDTPKRQFPFQRNSIIRESNNFDKFFLNDEDGQYGEYIFIECTGFSRSKILSDNFPEGQNREDELLTFAEAKKAGKKQFEQRQFVFAIDVFTTFQRITNLRPYPTYLIEIQSEIIDINWPEVCRSIREKHPLRKPATEEESELNIYVEPRLIKREKQQRLQAENNRLLEYHQFLEHILNTKSVESDKNIAIIGEPGCGKSTLLEKIAEEIEQQKKDLAISISLADLEDLTLEEYLEKKWLKDALPTIQSLLTQAAPSRLEPSQELKQALAQQFNTQENIVWLLLDGLDEMQVPSSTEALRSINSQISSGYLAGARVILTCRVNVWDAPLTNPLSNKFDSYEILEFEDSDRDKFITKWFTQFNHCQLGENLIDQLKRAEKQPISELAKNPLRLVLLCTFAILRQQSLPKTKADLYQSYLPYFYNWKKEICDLTDDYEKKEDLEQVLGNLALKGFESNSGYRFHQSEIYNVIKKEIQGKNERKELLNLVKNLGWLNIVDRDLPPKSENIYAFFHSTFQEYFAAKYLADHPNLIEQAVTHITDLRWREIFLLLAELQQADNLLPKIVRQIQIDPRTNFKLQSLLFWAKNIIDERATSNLFVKRGIVCYLAFAFSKSYKPQTSYYFCGQGEYQVNVKLFVQAFYDDYGKALAQMLPQVFDYKQFYDNAQKFADAYSNLIVECDGCFTQLHWKRGYPKSQIWVFKSYAIKYAETARDYLQHLNKLKVFQLENILEFINNFLETNQSIIKLNLEEYCDFLKNISSLILESFQFPQEIIDLSKEEVEVFENYFYVNKLMLDCKEAAADSVSPQIWNQIERQMFCPVLVNKKNINSKITQLLKEVNDSSQVLEIRLKALKSLKDIADSVSSQICNQTEHQNFGLTLRDKENVKRKIIKLLKELDNSSQILEIRLKVLKSLKDIDDNFNEIVVEIKDGSLSTQALDLRHTESIDLGNGITLDMVCIPGGQFSMGVPDDCHFLLGTELERPQHRVSVRCFFMGKFQVTQAQWRQVASFPRVDRELNPNPSCFKGDDLPVENVSWHDAIEFCNRLSKKARLSYRLPTEAEWEYACRANTITPYHFGEIITPDLANYTIEKTTTVGSFFPNSFGLYDMHGNVFEWCQDDWHQNYRGAPDVGRVWLSEMPSEKVIRGASFLSNHDSCCRAAKRGCQSPNQSSKTIGFRVVMSRPENEQADSIEQEV